ncbi:MULTISPECIES: hypothetical protein [unclassified Streptomyces]|uniref:hypothetical protein n=1 Tax=unclassified Streptomyces TaxID=2593676 RepID=UPI0033F8B052
MLRRPRTAATVRGAAAAARRHRLSAVRITQHDGQARVFVAHPRDVAAWQTAVGGFLSRQPLAATTVVT